MDEPGRHYNEICHREDIDCLIPLIRGVENSHTHGN